MVRNRRRVRDSVGICIDFFPIQHRGVYSKWRTRRQHWAGDESDICDCLVIILESCRETSVSRSSALPSGSYSQQRSSSVFLRCTLDCTDPSHRAEMAEIEGQAARTSLAKIRGFRKEKMQLIYWRSKMKPGKISYGTNCRPKAHLNTIGLLSISQNFMVS